MVDRESDVLVRAQRRVGTVLRGKYRLERVLGVGGMAVVYKATHRNQAEFAVKMLHPELSIRDDVRSRFLREGYAANSIKHAGVVMVLDDDVAEDGAAFLVMELLQGAEVEALWERGGGRMAPLEAAGIILQLLDVLDAAHAKGIVHRDIKPANMFVTGEGTVKVLDFGIARVRDAAIGGGNMTGSGLLLGTPAFMPPEQALAQSNLIDGQTDVWAAGATLFTLCTGHYVHEGENAPQLMVRAATVSARSMATVGPNLPPSIVQVVDRALSFDKAARWPTAGAMRDALESACRASFGKIPTKETVAAALVSQDMAVASTMQPPPASVGGRSGERPQAPTPVSTPSPRDPRPIVLADFSTTAKPIEATAVGSIPGVKKVRWAAPVAFTTGALILGGAFYALRAGTSPPPSPAAGVAVPAVALPSSTQRIAPLPTSAAVSAAASAAPSSSVARVSVTAAPRRNSPGQPPPKSSAHPASEPVPAPTPPVSTAQNPLDLPIK